MNNHKIGILITNIGSPDRPDKDSVKKYLTEFLMDERVIDIPHWKRKLLVKGIIVPFRSGRSAEAYKKIWLPMGSPLIIYSEEFTRKLQNRLPANYVCRFVSRYGKPSYREVLQEFLTEGITEIFLAPMFPQFASATTDSAVAHLQETIKSVGPAAVDIPVRVMPPFYDQETFIQAWKNNYEKYLGDFAAEQIIFSFHGLPERQVRKSDPSKNHCLSMSNCCELASGEILNSCYRAQCFKTAHSIAKAINLSAKDYQISFQSRLGSEPWLRPYTVDVLDQLIAKGIKRVLFICPAFVADCLETLEEIAVSLNEGWQRAGGEELRLIPSLNAEDHWVDAFANLIRFRANSDHA